MHAMAPLLAADFKALPHSHHSPTLPPRLRHNCVRCLPACLQALGGEAVHLQPSALAAGSDMQGRQAVRRLEVGFGRLGSDRRTAG